MRNRFLITVVAAAGLLIGAGGGFMAAGGEFVTAQVRPVEPVSPRVMAGPDIGFRVEGLRGERVVGRLVVNVDGRWVEAELTTMPMQLSTR